MKKVLGFSVIILVCSFVFAQDAIPKITARELVRAYRENEIRFNRAYLGKKVQVTGELVKVAVSDGAPMLSIKDGSLLDMFAYCKASEMNTAADLENGLNVTVEGTVNVILGKVILEDCIIIRR